eukprot:TRINITY_DN4492_c0_g3_i1.p1 TRINITY_DN4492_c0_g3~~TRINITY_DN4492_c0_g3_i1.p1  ORF type:complete len:258 (-),score=59.54 TRINITY_DN4492_c0_g3_i1:173-946(-)
MAKKLTLELIAQRTKSDKFASIKNLNLWGNDLDDVSVIQQLSNLEVLSLSVNKISTLQHFSGCHKLAELYLRKNSVADLSEIQYLASLRHLRVLWLWDNPCAEAADYRLHVIKALPQLVKLDNTEVTPEERQSAQMVSDEIEYSAPAQREPEVVQRAPVKKMSEPVSRVHAEADERPLPALMKDQKRQKSFKGNMGGGERNDSRPLVEKRQVEYVQGGRKEDRSENVLCAILALLKELDLKSLELVRRDIGKKLNSS